MNALGLVGIFQRRRWREPPAPAGNALKHQTVGLRVVLIDLSHATDLRTTRKRQRSEGFGEGLAAGNPRRPDPGRRPGPADHSLHTA